MTYEVQQTRWDRIVRRVTGSVGPGSRVSETISEVMPVIDLEAVPAELLLLGGTQLAWGQTLFGPVVAAFPYGQVLNPTDSGNIITITSVRIFSDTSQQLNIALTTEVMVTPDSQAIRDSRRGVAGIPVGQCRGKTDAAAPVFATRQRVVADTPLVWTDPNDLAVLSPGFAMQIAGTTLNTELALTWMWRERPAEESELQF